MRSVHLKGYFRKIRRKGSVLVKGGVCSLVLVLLVLLDLLILLVLLGF